MLLNSSEALSEIVGGKGASKFVRMIWGRLLNHMYEKNLWKDKGV